MTSFTFSTNQNNVAKKTAVNVLYFTSRCNFRCTYCYEHLDDCKQFDTSREQLVKTVTEIINREPEDQQTLIVLFGGEVTLRWNEAKYIMNYASMLKKDVFFNICTNGYRFIKDEFIKDYMNTNAYKTHKCSLDISFDGIGNYMRVLKNGKDSTNTIIEVFKKLASYGVPFRIRYTVHKGNINHHFEDIMLISKTFKPQRIVTAYTYALLDENDLAIARDASIRFADEFASGNLTIPVCSHCCSICRQCTRTKEFNAYYGENGMVLRSLAGENAKKFDHFAAAPAHNEA